MSISENAIKQMSMDWLIARWIAVKEGRYPWNTKYAEANQRRLKEEIRRRVPDGAILVWSHRRVRH